MNSPEMTFRGEDPNEKIIFVVRRHIWSFFKTGLLIVFILLVLSAITLFAQGSWITSWAIFILIPLILYVGYRAWFVWNNSVSMLTNRRIIIVEQNDWFNRTVREQGLENILTISHDVNGMMATMLNFGDVNIQASGGSEKDLTIWQVHDPYEIQQRITALQRENKQQVRGLTGL